MNLSSLYTPQEAIAWSVVGLLSILLVLNQGGADIYYDKTPYRDTPGFCRAYLNGEIL